MHATKPEGESRAAQRQQAAASPSSSELFRQRFILVATIVGTGPDGDNQVVSRSVVVDEWCEGGSNAKRQFEEWLDAQLDSEVPEDDSDRFRDDDPWEEGGF